MQGPKNALYIERKVRVHEELLSEAELLERHRFAIILGEPGSGKSGLMNSLAGKLGVRAWTANQFRFTNQCASGKALVIDAFDELARIENSGLQQLFSKATDARPTAFLIASRSSEWGQAATLLFGDFFGVQPVVARLVDFNVAEQKGIFEHHVPQEDFEAFALEISKFGLQGLLPNPQFLQLFADAFVESGRHFVNKRTIFRLAIERLAKEQNSRASPTLRGLSTDQKIALASEVFAKILLSGADGVSAHESSEDRTHPMLNSLIPDREGIDSILATRLFRPGDCENHHQPVHKIIVEYCAATYLNELSDKPDENYISDYIFPVMAPNGFLRDELRGLAGWMATLGGRKTQDILLAIDPYAILANGDPSQLEQDSKRRLIAALVCAESEDPYFRRSDWGRTFTMADFFDADLACVIEPILKKEGPSQLKMLLLELIPGSDVVGPLSSTIRALLHSESETDVVRSFANSCLEGEPLEARIHDFDTLLEKRSPSSLRLSLELARSLGCQAIGRNRVSSALKLCSVFYEDEALGGVKPIGRRYFIKQFVETLGLDEVVATLDDLSATVHCSCGRRRYECACVLGASKIVGLLLDQYFRVGAPPHDPQRVWSWMENLVFHESRTSDSSHSVFALKNDRELRRGIFTHVFGALSEEAKIREQKNFHFFFRCHSGLVLDLDDERDILDYASRTENVLLWQAFFQFHRINEKSSSHAALRRHMRTQACLNANFMAAWYRQERAARSSYRDNFSSRIFYSRRRRRVDRKKKSIIAANREYLAAHITEVERGENISFLIRCADLLYSQPNQLAEEVGSLDLPRKALRNCFPFILPHLPSVREIGELTSNSQFCPLLIVAYAACVEIIDAYGELGRLPLSAMRSIKASVNLVPEGLSTDSRNRVNNEINRLVFVDPNDAESFLRELVEVQLEASNKQSTDVWMLGNDEQFAHLRGPLALEWLLRYPMLSLSTLSQLFDLAVQWGDWEALTSIIERRCVECAATADVVEGGADGYRKFWSMRAWFFLESSPRDCWEYLTSDPTNIFLISEIAGRMSRYQRPFWPKLTPTKIEAVLEAFVDAWPSVVLPDSYGSDSPKGEVAYRFLREVVWDMGESCENESVFSVLDRILLQPRYADWHADVKSIRSDLLRKRAIQGFEPPTPSQVVALLNRGEVVTVEGVRRVVSKKLGELQRRISGGEFGTDKLFYQNGARLDENAATKIIASHLDLMLKPLKISISIEQVMKDDKRSDFTASKLLEARRCMLVAEVKGQWHPDLYSAAAEQLAKRYSIHPDADGQGVYIVLWFGPLETVAGKKRHGISCASELKASVEAALPGNLRGFIDVVVLDVSRN